MNAQQNKYLETKIQTATSEQLLIMLYDGAIRFCKQAIEGIRQKDSTTAHTNLLKAQDIIAELTVTLDKNTVVSESLLRMYEYFIYRLTEANLKKNAEPVEEIVKYLTDLKETWVQAALEVRRQSAVAAPIKTHA